MRKPKTIYVIEEGGKEIVDYDRLGRPIFESVTHYYPIKCDIEPFSNKLAETSYGLFVDATHRVFSRPSEHLKLDGDVKYNNGLYQITEVVRYDKHYETLLKKVGEGDEE